MIKISKGLDLPISGSPINTISDEPKVSSVALLSNDFIGMKPTMLVKEGETVKAGQKVFEDKKNHGVYFTSPAGGIVKDINRGDKRRFLSIEIDIKDTEEFVNFDIDNSVDQIKDCLIDSGLWNAFRTRPFNRTPGINEIPDAVFINCCDSNPLSIDPYEIILLNKNEFDEGLNVLTNFFSCNINLCYQNNNFDTSIENDKLLSIQRPTSFRTIKYSHF